MEIVSLLFLVLLSGKVGREWRLRSNIWFEVSRGHCCGYVILRLSILAFETRSAETGASQRDALLALKMCNEKGQSTEPLGPRVDVPKMVRGKFQDFSWSQSVVRKDVAY